MTLRCVIVDDSAAFLKAARALLQREGVAVHGVASTGADALSEVEKARPDVVLVDIDLGQESGFDVARQLTHDGELAPSQVILISTHSEADFADLIAQAPVAGFLSKSDLSASAISDLLNGGADKH
jgi:DNA-binding NarL/FixJ family response regulator